MKLEMATPWAFLARSYATKSHDYNKFEYIVVRLKSNNANF